MLCILYCLQKINWCSKGWTKLLWPPVIKMQIKIPRKTTGESNGRTEKCTNPSLEQSTVKPVGMGAEQKVWEGKRERERDVLISFRERQRAVLSIQSDSLWRTDAHVGKLENRKPARYADPNEARLIEAYRWGQTRRSGSGSQEIQSRRRHGTSNTPWLDIHTWGNRELCFL